MPNLLNDFHRPVCQITVYHQKSENDYYLEYAPVNFVPESKQYTVGAGSPLTEEQLSGLSKALSKREQTQQGYLVKGILPEAVLGFNPAPGGEQLVWYNKAQPRHLSFSAGLNIPNGLISLPPLVFRASSHGLSVYALDKNKKPIATTRLRLAPFHNTYTSSGNVCMGSARVGQVTGVGLETVMANWEKAFFMSEFTHLTGNTSPIEGNLNLLYKELSGSGKPFPVDVLKPAGKSIKSLF